MDVFSHPIEMFGYVASVLVFLTFCMKTLVWLRALAIASNLAFIAYGVGAQLAPILILHSVLLPMNLFRLWQHVTTLRRVRRAAHEDLTVEALMPFMQAVEASDGQTIFRKGDPADRLFYIDEGCVVIAEIGKVLKAGDIFGEIGLFSEGTARTATVKAIGRVRMCEIDRATVLRLYREHPEFGFALTRLVTDRLVENQNRLLQELAGRDQVNGAAPALVSAE